MTDTFTEQMTYRVKEELINKTVNKIAVDDGWIYYQESDGGKKERRSLSYEY